MRQIIVFAAAALALLPATQASAGDEKQFYSITLTEGRIASTAQQSGKGEQIEIQSFHWGPRQSTSNDGTRLGGAKTLTVDSSHTDTAQATGKRQHLPLRARTYYDAPLPQGSVRVKVKMPWLACRVGASYPRLELAGGGKRHVLEGVTVASCGRSSGDADDRPTEEVAFYYNSIG